MKTVFNAAQAAHAPTHEYFRGRLVPAFETPARVDFLVAALQGTPHAAAPTHDGFVASRDFGLAPLARVHGSAYLQFIQDAWDEWAAESAAAGNADPGAAFPAVWPVPGMRRDVVPANFAARMGLYSMDSGTPLTAGSWAAAYGGAQATLTGLALLREGERAAYVLTRPPGHHAGADFFGGYCFVNNAAVAAQAALAAGARKVAVLDVDYHHGNGTQAIFYERTDVFFASVHGDPRTEYPFYLGHADERGAGAGLGCNLNLPLAAGSPVNDWFAALDTALAALCAYGPELLIVSLGVDTYAGDPISHFGLLRPHFHELGQRLAAFGRPTLLVQEGGYATADIGLNVRAVLDGFDGLALTPAAP
jgi:acetoin utilization deacetylase AcuC-like enzyme